jgi:alcohol dehydrogenase
VKAPPSRYGSTPAEVVVGPVEGLGSACAELGITHALVVTDPGLASTSHVGRVTASLIAAGCRVSVYDRAQANPTDASMARCANAARAAAVDGFVAVGGGSSIDTAKGAAFLVANGGTMEDWHGFGTAPHALLPLIAVPTTAGTGSEAQSFTLVSRDADHTKFACGAATAMPRLAWLDARLVTTAPSQVALHAALDALSHGIEAATTKVATPDSRAHAIASVAKVWEGWTRLQRDPEDLAAHELVLVGACMAGQAIEAGMLGAAHAAANPLTAHHGVPHGLAVGCMIPSVIRFNASDPSTDATYRELADACGVRGGAHGLATAIEGVLQQTGARAALRELVCRDTPVATLVDEAMVQWTGTFNPVPMQREGYETLYADALP